ncbi:MAG: SMP-30/gluconolactonase/LRE family protein [Silicimonas sp.]|nr:SMP-30/gluconolactonase/LRE family protein [Silicimonas sp.]
MSDIFDDRRCDLGEGPLWHPGRGQLIWFDILGRKLLTREGGRPREVQFKEHVSAAGWVSDSELLIASERRLFLFDIDRERSEDVEGLEPDDATTRSNDGRADPWGGFWISTMGKAAESGRAVIHRYYQGRLTRLFGGLDVPNAISFAPDRSCAYFADSDSCKVMRQPLEPEHGWPEGDPEVFLDLTAEGLAPDGAVVDAGGNFWTALWGAWCVGCFGPDGTPIGKVGFEAAHTSCPAFGGPDLTTLYCTSALFDLSEENAAKSDRHGMTFAFPETGRGQAEHRVIL